MSITFNGNLSSLRMQHGLANTQRDMGKILERLSTGRRINHAGDDPSGLAIANNLQTKIQGMKVAEDNILQGQALLSTTEQALNSILSLVQEYRDLGVEASNGTVTNYTPYTNASSAIIAEITRISDATEFNGIKLLDGTNASLTIQIGPDNNANHRLTLSSIFGDIDSTVLSLSTITSSGTAATAITNADAAVTTVNNRLSNVGGYQQRLQSSLDLLQTTKENYAAAESNIRDADVAQETANLTRLEVLMQAGTAMLAQANQMPAVGLSLLGG